MLYNVLLSFFINPKGQLQNESKIFCFYNGFINLFMNTVKL